jgi:Tfp pilus assembly protein PilP
MIDFLFSLPVAVLVVVGLIVVGACARGMEQTALMTYVQHHETDPAARILKVQAIQNLNQIDNAFLRSQVVNHILK